MCYVKPEWKIVPENLAFVKHNSCMCNGLAGCGKTEMKNSSTENTLCLCFTNKAKNVCFSRGIEHSLTFETYFGTRHSHDQTQKAIKSLGHYEKIDVSVHVDEFTMTPNLYFRLLLKAKRMFPNLKFNFFGDPNQCTAPEKIWFDYMTSKLVMELCGYNMMSLSYKNTRYDPQTKIYLDYFIEHKKLPDICKGKNLLESLTRISYLNHTRHTINHDRLVDYCEEKKKEVINVNNKFDVAEGIPVVEEENDHINKLYNGQMFTLDKIDEKTNTFIIERDKKKQTVDLETFYKYFNLGFCCTVYKYQGDTIFMT